MKKFFLILLLIIVSIVGTVWFFPGIIINNKTFAMVLEKVQNTPGTELKIENPNIKAYTSGFFTKTVLFTSGQTCFDLNNGEWKGCAKNVDLKVSARLTSWPPYIDVEKAVLEEGEVMGRIAQTEEKEEKKKEDKDSGSSRFPLDKFKFRQVKLDIKKILVSMAEGASLAGKFSAHTQGEEASLKVDLNSEITYRTEDPAKYIETKVTAGVSQNGEASATIDATVREFGIPKLDLLACKVGYQSSTIELNCPMAAAGYFDTGKSKLYRKLIPTLDGVLSGKVELKKEIKGLISLELDPLLKMAKEGRGRIDLDINGSYKEFPQGLQINTKGNIEVTQFKRIADLLSETPWAIPEPFNGLDGKIVFDAKGEGKLGDFAESSYPLKLTCSLNSKTQRLNFSAEGKYSLHQKGDDSTQNLDLKVSLDDIHLSLPRLEPSSLPKLFPDKRIKLKREVAVEKKTKGTSHFTYNVEIATPKDSFLRITSNLARDTVPLTINLTMTDKTPMQGSIRVASFPVEMFRRKAKVDHFDMYMKGKADQTEVNGKIRVFYTDYTVFVSVLGLATAPQIKVETEPPLPESEAMAVLLFGRKPEALDPGEAQSAGSTQAAVADQAIGLASMYLLASTPIESVNYDPNSSSFNARVKLADGTSMSVGTNLRELEQIGIRRRIGRNWSISTYLDEPLNPTERTVSAFLEWSKAY